MLWPSQHEHSKGGIIDVPQSDSPFRIRSYVACIRLRQNLNWSWPFSRKLLKNCLKEGKVPLLPSLDPSRRQPFVKFSCDNLLAELEAFGKEEEEVELPPWIGEVMQDVDSLDRPEDEVHSPKATIWGVRVGHSGNDRLRSRGSELSEEAPDSGGQEEFIVGELEYFEKEVLCPVCNEFASSSHVEMNAHIDSCLFEKNLNKVKNRDRPPFVTKPKARKKRSMADICATAPTCSLPLQRQPVQVVTYNHERMEEPENPTLKALTEGAGDVVTGSQSTTPFVEKEGLSTSTNVVEADKREHILNTVQREYPSTNTSAIGAEEGYVNWKNVEEEYPSTGTDVMGEECSSTSTNVSGEECSSTGTVEMGAEEERSFRRSSGRKLFYKLKVLDEIVGSEDEELL